jgi:hypothetical protein
MKNTRWLVLFFCLLAVLVPVLPVYANPMISTMTKVIITQNGIPVDDTVDFSLDCYGRPPDWPGYLDLPRYGVEKLLNIIGYNDAVYAYTATCRPAENCIVHKPEIPSTLIISHCDISGTYKGQPFLLKNFSREPVMSSVREIVLLDTWENTYAIPVQAQRECSDQRTLRDNACKKNFNESQVTKSDSGATPEYRHCQDESKAAFFACIKDNGTWINETEVGGASHYNELWFDIPSDNNSKGTVTRPDILPETYNKNTTFTTHPLSGRSEQCYTVQTISPTIPRSPVESLFCGILSMVNLSC